MAKSLASHPSSKKKGVSSTYPSVFGSHASMIDEEETAKLTDATLVALRDENGVYITERTRVDSGMADPNRYEENRLVLLAKKKEVKEVVEK